jgi:hypothetical protein
MSQLLRFKFREADRETVEADVALAIFAAECLHGRPRVRMEASYLVDDDGRACLLEIGGEAGESVARVFAGLCAARFGEEAYSVQRLAHERASTAGVI